MTSVSLERYELALTFQQTEVLVYRVAGMFYREHYRDGRGWKDVKQEAYLGFLLAHQSFDPSLGYKFSTWLSIKVYYHLKNYFRKECKALPVRKNEEGEYEQNFLVWDDFLGEFSKDAREVINLCVQSPLDVLLLIKKRGLPTGKNVRLAVRQYLQEDGWNDFRIQRAFREVKSKLRGREK